MLKLLALFTQLMLLTQWHICLHIVLKNNLLIWLYGLKDFGAKRQSGADWTGLDYYWVIPLRLL